MTCSKFMIGQVHYANSAWSGLNYLKSEICCFVSICNVDDIIRDNNPLDSLYGHCSITKDVKISSLC